MEELVTKIENNTSFVGIIGLGYVGLPLAIAFSKMFDMVRYDVYYKCIANLLSRKSHILDVLDSTLHTYLGKSFFPTKNPEKVVDDFGLAYSPERIDPGNRQFNVENAPKIVGRINEGSTEIAALLYNSVIDEIVRGY